MKTARLPGFTAEAAVRRLIAFYRATAASKSAAGGLVAALPIGVEPDWLDCNQWPEGDYCIECGSTGPGSLRCCRNDYCVVIDRRLWWAGARGFAR